MPLNGSVFFAATVWLEGALSGDNVVQIVGSVCTMVAAVTAAVFGWLGRRETRKRRLVVTEEDDGLKVRNEDVSVHDRPPRRRRRRSGGA